VCRCRGQAACGRPWLYNTEEVERFRLRSSLHPNAKRFNLSKVLYLSGSSLGRYF
jgi:hypothetical protein